MTDEQVVRILILARIKSSGKSISNTTVKEIEVFAMDAYYELIQLNKFIKIENMIPQGGK